MSDFNPYSEWLQIPEGKQPNHYELLGVVQFESDLTTIQAAADSHLELLARFLSGQHRDDASRLQSEVAAALNCLTELESKTAYDQELLQAKFFSGSKKSERKTPETATDPIPRDADKRSATPEKRQVVEPKPRRSETKLRSAPTPKPPPPPPTDARVTSTTQTKRLSSLVLNEEHNEPVEEDLAQRPRSEFPQQSASPAIIATVVVASLISAGTMFWFLAQPEPDEADVSQRKTRAARTTERSSVVADNSSRFVNERPSVGETISGNSTSKTKLEPRARVDPNDGSSKPAEPTEPPPVNKPTDNLAKAVTALQNQPINLLQQIDVAKHSVSGNWQLENEVLTVDSSDRGQLQLPFAIPEEYELLIEVNQIRGENGIDIGVQIAGRHVVVVIDGWSGGASGIDVLDGQSADRNETAVYGRALSKDEVNVIRCSIGRDFIRVTSNDEPIVNWQGDVNRLSFPAAYRRPREPSVFLASNGTAYQIARMELTIRSPSPSGSMKLSITGSERTPIPDEGALAEAKLLVGDVFQASIDQAKTPPETLAIAKQLVEQGTDETNNAAAARLVMLRLALDLAISAGDVSQGFAIVDELAKGFRIDRLEAKSNLYEAMQSSAKTRDAIVAFTEEIVLTIEEAIGSDDYDIADVLLKTARATSIRSRDRTLQRKISELREEVAKLRSSWQEFAAATESLKANSQDPAAHLVRGCYLCFVKGRWRAGLTSLAKTSDAQLVALAKRDLALPTEPADKLKLADDWWTWTQASEVRETYNAFPHYWYRMTIQDLAGLAKIKVEKRLEQIGTPRTVRQFEPNR